MTNLALNQETNNTEAKVKSNDLRHSININDTTANAEIKIRLNDQCKNGHQDFSITATIWEIGKQRTDRNMISGCCHEEILKLRPDLKIFVDLHLCDFNGAPMYASANGFYHLKNGFNKTKPQDAGFKAEFCDYYRLTAAQFDVLILSESETRFKYNLEKLGIISQWQKQAKEGIKRMEELTGNEFVNDSKRSQYTPLTAEEIKTEEQRESEGYYTAEAITEREEQKRTDALQKIKNDLKAHMDKEIQKEVDEYNIKIEVLNAGLNLDNFIYYTHSNEGVFNWKGYGDIITAQQFDKFSKLVDYSKLPKGIKFKLSK